VKKVILFGTGNGSKEYLLKYGSELDVVAIVDNDKEKEGTIYQDNLIISSPSSIASFDYDEIIIVSQWAKEISSQLEKELNVDISKIYIPPKKDIKDVQRPFEDPNTRELAREIIKKLSYYAIEDNIPLLVDFGTLLGIVRDNDVILWDDDVDFSIVNLPLDVEFETWLLNAIGKINLPVNLNIKSKIVDNKQVSFILFFKHESYKTFSISISLRELKDDRYIHLPSGGMWYSPQKFFDKYEIIEWDKHKVMVPFCYKEYLEFLYGDWKKPKKDITMTDYANLGEVKYEDFIKSGDGYKEIM